VIVELGESQPWWTVTSLQMNIKLKFVTLLLFKAKILKHWNPLNKPNKNKSNYSNVIFVLLLKSERIKINLIYIFSDLIILPVFK
jgi:hypothetical protein